jgi:DNA-binding CsgD family transcriptional regulator
MQPLDEYEHEALRLFANGNSPPEIAHSMEVSESMANHFLRVATRKLGARNRVHAVAKAVRLRLVLPEGGPD